MLKSCWDCVLGYSQRQENNEQAYGTQLNGGSLKAPPWPATRAEGEIMFILPKALGPGDKIEITGSLRTDRRKLDISLRTENHLDVACQFVALFPDSERGDDTISTNNGTEEKINDIYSATSLFPDSDLKFSFSIRLRNDNPLVEIYVSETYVETIRIHQNLADIRYLTLNSDVEKIDKLQFEFGNE